MHVLPIAATRAMDPLALRYNDVSPMENHHVSAAFTLLREEQYNVLENLPRQVGGGTQQCNVRGHMLCRILPKRWPRRCWAPDRAECFI